MILDEDKSEFADSSDDGKKSMAFEDDDNSEEVEV
jgi:hypothetical protein